MSDGVRKIAATRKANGFLERSKNPKLSVTFPRSMFVQILLQADIDGLSAGEMIRRLCAASLEPASRPSSVGEA